MVTIYDVARRLNLSITTVSRALGGYSDVSEQTRLRVRQTAEEMGYFPNHAARQLRSHRSKTIGFILPTSLPRFTDPFFSEFLAGIGDVTGAAGFDLLVSVAPPNSPEERSLYRRWIQERKVDGWLLTQVRINDWRVEYLTEMKMSFVSLGRSKSHIDYPYIEIESEKSISNLVKHLAKKGHQRIGFIGASEDLSLHAARFGGYLRGLELAGIKLNLAWFEKGDLTRQGGYTAMRRLLVKEPKPSAVVCVNDLTALGAYRAVRESGLVLGKDIAVSGFDGIEEGTQADPPLTTLAYSIYDVAREMGNVLLENLRAKSFLDNQQVVIPELRLRASTGD